MSLAFSAPLAHSRLGRFNPVAKVAAAAIALVGLLITVDVVSASIVLGAEALGLVVSGLDLRVVARRAWPIPLAALGVAVANRFAAGVGPVTSTAVSLRLIAIALPGVLVFAATDAVDLADSLVQQLKVPPRFAYGSLAALRLLPLLVSEWDMIHRARRARGIDAGWSPLKKLSLFASAVFALLVAAVRRAARLAMAMDSRGFASGRPRTMARRQLVHARDWALVAAVASVVALANVAAVLTGQWHPLLG